MTHSSASTVPAWASRLGHAGLLPFIALAAWVLMAAPDRREAAALALLAVLLRACCTVDRSRYPARGAGHWLPMRLRLTTVASLACLAAAAAVSSP